MPPAWPACRRAIIANGSRICASCPKARSSCATPDSWPGPSLHRYLREPAFAMDGSRAGDRHRHGQRTATATAGPAGLFPRARHNSRHHALRLGSPAATCSPPGADAIGHLTRHLPMQNRVKMRSSRSSVKMAPVISPNSSRARQLQARPTPLVLDQATSAPGILKGEGPHPWMVQAAGRVGRSSPRAADWALAPVFAKGSQSLPR